MQIVRVGGALAFVGLIRLNKLMGMIEFIELKVDSSWLIECGARRSDRGVRNTV